MSADFTHLPAFGPELTALLKQKHGQITAAANLTGLDAGRVSNCCNDSLRHHLGVDESLALVLAGVSLRNQAFYSLRARMVEYLMGEAEPVETDGSWKDEALSLLELVAGNLKALPTEVKDMTANEKSRLTAAALNMQRLAGGILAEMGTQPKAPRA